jgi:hypothetical protein
MIDRLFETGYDPDRLGKGNAASNDYSAGFQLALWEIVNDSPVSPNVNSGTFSATGAAGARAVANDILAALNNPFTNKYNVLFLESVGKDAGHAGHYSQHLVTISEVPLPAAIWLLLAGLGGLAGLRRRRALA